jgi:hypothetical protein
LCRRYSNQYDWRAFLAALVCSSGIAILWSACAWLLRRTAGVNGPGISVLMHIPGMKILTATPNWTPNGQERLPVTGPALGAADGKDVLAAPITSTGSAK